MKRVLLIVVLAALGASLATRVSAADPAPSFTRTIYLVRHGAYEMRSDTGSPDGPGLTPLGIAQSRLVAGRLRSMPVIFSSLVASTMTRAQETARVMHETLTDLAMRSTPLLRECTPAASNPKVTRETPVSEAEACQKQLNEAFSTYFVPASGADQNDVLVCHGNVIRYFVTKALGVDTKAWLGMSVTHASLTVIRITPQGRLIVLSVGDVGHIPPSMQSGTTAVDPELVVPKPVAAVVFPLFVSFGSPHTSWRSAI